MPHPLLAIESTSIKTIQNIYSEILIMEVTCWFLGLKPVKVINIIQI